MSLQKEIFGKIGLPPVIPTINETLEKYLWDFESLPIHDPVHTRKWHSQPLNVRNLYEVHLSPVKTHVGVDRDMTTGEIIGVKEYESISSGSTNKNSFSLCRAPGPPEEAVRGSSTNFPFWPGGIPIPDLRNIDVDTSDLFNPDKYLTKHPKLSGGIPMPEKKNDVNEEAKEVIVDVNIADILNIHCDSLKLFDIDIENQERNINTVNTDSNLMSDEEKGLENKLSDVLQTAKPVSDVIKISIGPLQGKVVAKGTEWAEVIDVNSPVDDFYKRVPQPACSYPFELDNFQKQAIMHLEQHNSVFVAAHTSAGKTVVAEYAIALSLKHMTRAIYTSPIKALSNQKYRDLKIKFDDVGLLTGDIQINSKASCLIMTTEILQSMLYNGSDIIRDLEHVIFDEVHYINNAERGHVWEEVIIMLPSHVNIILLSATVPNTVEFADWIGRIKKRKIYVISTTKRPVPLEHFLYTGTGGKSKDDRFLLIDSGGTYINQGYNDALASKKEREKKSQQTHGPKPGFKHHLGEKQEKNLLIGLIDHLNKRELLPVVVFTLSRKRCDINAAQLESEDLTTKVEKGHIHSFIKKCVDRLQGTDKMLPQVQHMTNLLKKGIGVHHSGILPLLKEVVEMLFAKGLVKLLFATETFAMGVNMPARCVVFDSIRKHDGIRFRDLLPSEYIQMAGRAGRRGLDTTGTVIVLCKTDVPESSDLHRMMLGKPTKLESQFKLTYSMILNLLRVEALRVEDMLKRSFSESLQLKNQSKYEADIKLIQDKFDALPEISCLTCQESNFFYATSREYVERRREAYKIIITHPNMNKYLICGRVILLSFEHYQNNLACVMRINPNDKDKFIVFILKEKTTDTSSRIDNEIKACLAAPSNAINSFINAAKHDVIEVGPENIAAITSKVIKVDGEKVIKNVKERQMPRFRDNPPGQSVQQVITELERLNETKGEGLTFIDLITDLGVKELNAVEKLHTLARLRSSLQEDQCIECPEFAEHFAQSFQKLKFQEEIGNLKYLVSEESLQLHPEYQSCIKVLKMLGYIEDNRTVTLKGRVACDIGNHELMVTELLLENVFADKPIEIIASLLSSLVFQQKNCSEPNLTKELKSGIVQFKNVAKKIGEAQRDCGLKEPVGDFIDQFNFGLAEVVYEWAHGMPFHKIMELTDIQEGITVKCIQRLDETLNGVRKAARIIGDPNLYEKMEQASLAVKRDIVFAASLYTQ